ncbi:MAG: hypothetical protein QN131_00380 [Armatimonadota bacterium]|nr:hypothetical protein [Armatimonadota bacterium]MDR7548381.1 hypothetical protein [Armatimonadota bacterium]
MTRDALLFLLVMTLGLAIPVIAQQHLTPPTQIQPGQEIAAVRLGQSAPSVLNRLGPPAETRALPDGTLYAFPRYGINVYVTDGIVRAVSTTNGLMRTGEAIAVGAAVGEVRRVFGTQFVDAVVEGLMGMAYDQQGIAFGLDGGVVSIILIYPPKVRPAALAVPAVSNAPAAAPAAATPVQVDPGLVVVPRVDQLKPFSPETYYMSVPGFLRYVVRQQTGAWLTQAEAMRMLQDQRRLRL